MTAPGRGPAATSPKRSGAVVARDPDAWGSKALFFVLMLGSLAATSSAVAQIDTPAELKVIEGMRFEGRHHVPRKDLDAVLKTRTPYDEPSEAR